MLRSACCGSPWRPVHSAGTLPMYSSGFRKHPCSRKSLFRDYFPEAEASLLEEISRQGLFSRGESIPARRNSPSGIIFPRRMHPCSKKSPVKDYFPEADASLLEEIHRQGLFSRGGCIPAQRNPPSGIILPRQKHPCSEKSPFRDYFPEADASLLREIPRQGLFSRGGCIPARRNPPPGIIFPRRMHPCSEKSPVRDYFPEADASLFGEISRQGLFSQGESIPAQRNPPSGIIFSRRMHPCLEKSPVRDYFPEAKASLLREISRQGLFARGESIPARRNPLSGIIFPRRMHPCSEKSLFRDYFLEAKASLLGEIPFQGLFSRGGCIPAQRNPFSGIIFSRRKHPCSEKSPVRDYFPEADASLLEEISRQGLFSRGGCIPA